jgi:hypothetical protein
MNDTGNPSFLPGWHPDHICGLHCDGQDGKNSQCAQEKASAQSPTALDKKVRDIVRIGFIPLGVLVAGSYMEGGNHHVVLEGATILTTPNREYALRALKRAIERELAVGPGP